jgi:hypothetical protein
MRQHKITAALDDTDANDTDDSDSDSNSEAANISAIKS